MPLILVRHASAGDRDEWEDDDRERPLDDRGFRQARELASRLAAYRIDEIHTSPYLRCLQTVAPLAAALDIEPRVRAELSEEQQGRDGEALLRELAERAAVVCGHGGLDQAVQGAPKWKKGAAFVLDRDLRLVEQI